MNGLTRRRRLAMLFLLCATMLAIQAGCGRTPANRKKAAVASQSAVELTAENFQREVLDSTQPVMVDCWASWCGPCIAFAPTVEELAAEFDGRAVIGKLNVDNEEDLANQYDISAIPTILIFKDGQVVDRYVGGETKKALALRLNGLISEVSGSDSAPQQSATLDASNQSIDYTAAIERGRRRAASGSRY